MLERPGPSSTQSGQRLRIPAGTYNLTNSPGTAKDKRLHAEWELYNDQVPTSRHILFHYGNTADQTDGCLIPGFGRLTDKVYNPDLNNRATDALNSYINSLNGNVIVHIYDNSNP